MSKVRPISRSIRLVAVAAAAVPLWMCAPAAPVTVAAPERGPVAALAERSAPARGAVTDHVVVISIDGLRPDAIERFGARTLQRLMREGSYSLEASTILPSITLPSHTSMLTGVGPEVHGISWNKNLTHEHGTLATPTIFARARQAGFRTAAFFSKGKFNHLLVAGTLDHGTAPAGNGRWYAGHTAENVERYLEESRPNLLFVHFGEPDYAGHTIGWMSFVYGWAVRRADGAVARVLAAADDAFGAGNYAVIVTADHGGHGRTHGTEDPLDVTIPWVAWGEGVQAGRVLPAGIHTTDTAATALWLLGLALPGDQDGQPVLTAFDLPSAAPLVAAAGEAR